MTHQLCILVGNLGKDPEGRFIPNGTQVVSFNVATNRTYPDPTDKTKRIKETTWFRCSAWDKLAETCHTYLKKGSKVYVEGRLSCDPATGGPRMYQRQDGSVGASFEVTAHLVRFLDSKENGGTSEAPAEAVAEGEAEASDAKTVPF